MIPLRARGRRGPDGENWTQRVTGVAPGPRANAGMAYDFQRGRVVLFGGGGATIDAETWEWDGTQWLQRFPTTAPARRHALMMACDEVPPEPGVVGLRFYDQALVLDPPANPVGLTLSNGGAGVVGRR